MNKWYKLKENGKLKELEEDPLKFEKGWMDSWIQCPKCGKVRSVIKQRCECEIED